MTKKKKQVFPQNWKGKFILLAAARSGKTDVSARRERSTRSGQIHLADKQMKKQKSDALEQGLTILEFIRHPQLLNDQSNSMVQDLMLKAIYGLGLDDAEQELFVRSPDAIMWPVTAGSHDYCR